MLPRSDASESLLPFFGGLQRTERTSHADRWQAELDAAREPRSSKQPLPETGGPSTVENALPIDDPGAGVPTVEIPGIEAEAGAGDESAEPSGLEIIENAPPEIGAIPVSPEPEDEAPAPGVEPLVPEAGGSGTTGPAPDPILEATGEPAVVPVQQPVPDTGEAPAQTPGVVTRSPIGTSPSQPTPPVTEVPLDGGDTNTGVRVEAAPAESQSEDSGELIETAEPVEPVEIAEDDATRGGSDDVPDEEGTDRPRNRDASVPRVARNDPAAVTRETAPPGESPARADAPAASTGVASGRAAPADTRPAAAERAADRVPDRIDRPAESGNGEARAPETAQDGLTGSDDSAEPASTEEIARGSESARQRSDGSEPVVTPRESAPVVPTSDRAPSNEAAQTRDVAAGSAERAQPTTSTEASATGATPDRPAVEVGNTAPATHGNDRPATPARATQAPTAPETPHAEVPEPAAATLGNNENENPDDALALRRIREYAQAGPATDVHQTTPTVDRPGLRVNASRSDIANGNAAETASEEPAMPFEEGESTAFSDSDDSGSPRFAGEQLAFAKNAKARPVLSGGNMPDAPVSNTAPIDPVQLRAELRELEMPKEQATRVHHRNLAEAIVARARTVPHNGSVEVRFALEPEDLGLVRVRIESRGDQVKIRIVAASSAAAETISSGVSRLASQLVEAGHERPDIDLTYSDAPESETRERRQAARESHSQRTFGTASETTGESVTEPSRRPGKTARLDRTA